MPRRRHHAAGRDHRPSSALPRAQRSQRSAVPAQDDTRRSGLHTVPRRRPHAVDRGSGPGTGAKARAPASQASSPPLVATHSPPSGASNSCSTASVSSRPRPLPRSIVSSTRPSGARAWTLWWLASQSVPSRCSTNCAMRPAGAASRLPSASQRRSPPLRGSKRTRFSGSQPDVAVGDLDDSGDEQRAAHRAQPVLDLAGVGLEVVQCTARADQPQAAPRPL